MISELVAMGRREKERETDRPNPMSLRIVRQIAIAEGIDPEDVPSLAHRIDFEALDTLFASSSANLMLSLSIDGYGVEVTSDGTVVLD